VKKESIIEIFSDILDLEKDIINLESSPEDIDEWDSLANVNIIIALEEELRTKFKLEDLEDIKRLSALKQVGVISASNFALGAVVLMHLARIASKYFDYADLLESHHEAKIDAPSGTALSIAEAMIEGRGSGFDYNVVESQILEGTRGGDFQGINVHSARMPGRVARHEVVFGALGQTLTMIHDSINRESFMPGVMIAVKRVSESDELVIGLASVLGLDKLNT